MKSASDGFGASAKNYIDPQLRRALANDKLARSRHGAARQSREADDPQRRHPHDEGRPDELRDAPPTDAGEATANAAESQFLRKAAMLNMTALEAGHCAERQCEDAGLRGLASQMVGVLGRIDAECRVLAKGHAVPVADRLDQDHRAQVTLLEELDGAAFEQTYLLKYAMEAQLELIRLCGAQLTEGVDETLRAAAGRWLQDLRSALVLSRQLYFTTEAG